jgi:hypothetical protein
MNTTIVAPGSRDGARPDRRPYVLGHSDDEFRRLEGRAGYYRQLTENVFVRASRLLKKCRGRL